MENFWERTTASFRRAVYTAQDLATRERAEQVTTEHLLRGVVSFQNVATTFLRHSNVERIQMRTAVEVMTGAAAASTKVDNKLTGEPVNKLSEFGHQAVIYAGEEYGRFGNKYIGVEHLLLGLIRCSETPSGKLLARLGVTVERIREAEKILFDNTLAFSYFPEEATEENLAIILSSLKSQDASVREEALDQLHRYVNYAAYDRIDCTLSGHAGAEAEYAAAKEVWQDTRIAAALLSAMDDPEVIVRHKVPLHLGHVKTTMAQDAIIRHLNDDPSDEVRRACVMGLSYSFDSPQKLSAYINALHDRFENVVSYACIILGKLGDKQATGPLRTVLAHPSWSVRFKACNALVILEDVDELIVSVLEELNRQPEASKHNEMVLEHREMSKDLPEDAPKPDPPRTTDYVLELARASLRL